MSNNHNKSRKRKREKMECDEWDIDIDDRIEYNNNQRWDFEAQLYQEPWNDHKYYGKHPIYGSCIKIVNKHKRQRLDISNWISTKPTRLFPHQAAIAAKKGYLPEYDDADIRISDDNHNNRNISDQRRRRRRQRIFRDTSTALTREERAKKRKRQKDTNYKKYLRIKGNRGQNRQRQQNRNRNRNKHDIRLLLSHICGNKNCISLSHMRPESGKDNKDRETCHKYLDRMAAKYRKLKREEKGYNKYYLNHNRMYYFRFSDIPRSETDVHVCQHTPKCFRNYNCIDYVSYYQPK